MNKIVKLVKEHTIPAVITLVFVTMVGYGVYAYAGDNIKAYVDRIVETSETTESISDSIMFNTNQDHITMRSAVLKQKQKLESDPEDIKTSDMEMLEKQCGLMDVWEAKGYSVTQEREVCALFNDYTAEKIRNEE